MNAITDTILAELDGMKETAIPARSPASCPI